MFPFHPPGNVGKPEGFLILSAGQKVTWGRKEVTLSQRTHTCAYEGVRSISFSENFAF